MDYLLGLFYFYLIIFLIFFHFFSYSLYTFILFRTLLYLAPGEDHLALFLRIFLCIGCNLSIRIFFINGFLCFLENEWQRNGERKRERRCHFKEKMSLEEAHHHRRPWIRAWRKKEMNEGRGREEHEILCSK
ncbi:hypothetical protein HKD37_11G032327 [Glycine soja]